MSNSTTKLPAEVAKYLNPQRAQSIKERILDPSRMTYEEYKKKLKDMDDTAFKGAEKLEGDQKKFKKELAKHRKHLEKKQKKLKKKEKKKKEKREKEKEKDKDKQKKKKRKRKNSDTESSDSGSSSEGEGGGKNLYKLSKILKREGQTSDASEPPSDVSESEWADAMPEGFVPLEKQLDDELLPMPAGIMRGIPGGMVGANMVIPPINPALLRPAAPQVSYFNTAPIPTTGSSMLGQSIPISLMNSHPTAAISSPFMQAPIPLGPPGLSSLLPTPPIYPGVPLIGDHPTSTVPTHNSSPTSGYLVSHSPMMAAVPQVSSATAAGTNAIPSPVASIEAFKQGIAEGKRLAQLELHAQAATAHAKENDELQEAIQQIKREAEMAAKVRAAVAKIAHKRKMMEKTVTDNSPSTIATDGKEAIISMESEPKQLGSPAIDTNGKVEAEGEEEGNVDRVDGSDKSVKRSRWDRPHRTSRWDKAAGESIDTK